MFVQPFKNLFAAVGASGKMYLMVPGDTIRPWRNTADTFAEIVNEAIGLRATGLEIWVLGDVNPAMAANAERHGVTVRQNILRNPRFFPEAEQRF